VGGAAVVAGEERRAGDEGHDFTERRASDSEVSRERGKVVGGAADEDGFEAAGALDVCGEGEEAGGGPGLVSGG
jgi:hypothetical protein